MLKQVNELAEILLLNDCGIVSCAQNVLSPFHIISNPQVNLQASKQIFQLLYWQSLALLSPL